MIGGSVKLGKGVYVAPNAVVIGDVEVGEGSSIWFNVVLRGDVNSIKVGKRTNIQDGTIIHSDSRCKVVIGDEVSIGHSCMVHGCKIDDNALIGIGAVVLTGAVVGESSLVAANSVVTKNTIIPPRSFVVGTPAKVKDSVSEDQRKYMDAAVASYVRLSKRYLRGEFP